MEDELERVVRHLVEHRWPFRLHATYNESISRMLDVFEKVNRDIPFNGLHWFFDHAETVTEPTSTASKRWAAVLPCSTVWPSRANTLNVTAKKPPPHAAGGENAGDRRAGGLGTDATRVASYNPWTALYWLVSGRTVGGMQMYDDSARLDRDTALMLWTAGSAWFSSEQGQKGQIKVGQLADLAVLSKDYFRVPEEEIKGIESVLTVVNGDIVYAAGSFGPPRRPPFRSCPSGPRWSRCRATTAARRRRPHASA
jgi:predicted amidohydrolase YtcJ